MKLMLENIAKEFPGRKIFDNISIVIEKGETLVITGPNGSGKTTLMKIICSLLPPSSGTVFFQHVGRKLSGAEILPYMGIVGPDIFLYDELTANENLEFFAEVSSIGKSNFEDELAKFGLRGRGDDLVRSYSTGMKQRLKFILAMMRNPPLFLFDEPTTNLDDSGKSIVDDIIRNHEGIVVIATSEGKELRYADQTIRLGE